MFIRGNIFIHPFHCYISLLKVNMAHLHTFPCDFDVSHGGKWSNCSRPGPSFSCEIQTLHLHVVTTCLVIHGIIIAIVRIRITRIVIMICHYTVYLLCAAWFTICKFSIMVIWNHFSVVKTAICMWQSKQHKADNLLHSIVVILGMAWLIIEFITLDTLW